MYYRFLRNVRIKTIIKGWRGNVFNLLAKRFLFLTCVVHRKKYFPEYILIHAYQRKTLMLFNVFLTYMSRQESEDQVCTCPVDREELDRQKVKIEPTPFLISILQILIRFLRRLLLLLVFTIQALSNNTSNQICRHKERFSYLFTFSRNYF